MKFFYNLVAMSLTSGTESVHILYHLKSRGGPYYARCLSICYRYSQDFRVIFVLIKIKFKKQNKKSKNRKKNKKQKTRIKGKTYKIYLKMVKPTLLLCPFCYT